MKKDDMSAMMLKVLMRDVEILENLKVEQVKKEIEAYTIACECIVEAGKVNNTRNNALF